MERGQHLPPQTQRSGPTIGLKDATSTAHKFEMSRLELHSAFWFAAITARPLLNALGSKAVVNALVTTARVDVEVVASALRGLSVPPQNCVAAERRSARMVKRVTTVLVHAIAGVGPTWHYVYAKSVGVTPLPQSAVCRLCCRRSCSLSMNTGCLLESAGRVLPHSIHVQRCNLRRSTAG